MGEINTDASGSNVSMGFSHSSYTVDPGYYNPPVSYSLAPWTLVGTRRYSAFTGSGNFEYYSFFASGSGNNVIALEIPNTGSVINPFFQLSTANNLVYAFSGSSQLWMHQELPVNKDFKLYLKNRVLTYVFSGVIRAAVSMSNDELPLRPWIEGSWYNTACWQITGSYVPPVYHTPVSIEFKL